MLYALSIPESVDDAPELRILEWHAAPGAHCVRGMLLVELETYKSVIEIRAGQEAYLRQILVPAGMSEGRGKPIALFSDAPGEALPAAGASLLELAVEFSFM